MMELRYKKTGLPVGIDDTVTDFRGDKARVVGWSEPRHEGSSGRIIVSNLTGIGRLEFYPSVFGCEFQEK